MAKPFVKRTFSPLPAKQNSLESTKKLSEEVKALALPSRTHVLPIRRPLLNQKFKAKDLTARWESKTQGQKQIQSSIPEVHKPVADQPRSVVPSKREASEIDHAEPTFFTRSPKPVKQQKQYVDTRQSQSAYSHGHQLGRSATLSSQMRKIAHTSPSITGSHYTAPSASSPMATGEQSILSQNIRSMRGMSPASFASPGSVSASGRSDARLTTQPPRSTATSLDPYISGLSQDTESVRKRRSLTPFHHPDTGPDTTAYPLGSEDENEMAGPDFTFSDHALKEDPYSTIGTLVDEYEYEYEYPPIFRGEQEEVDNDTQSVKDAFYEYQQQCFRRNDSKFSKSRGTENDLSDTDDATTREETNEATLPDLTASAQNTVSANNGRRRSTRKPPASKPTDVDNSHKGPVAKRKKRGPVPVPKSITPLESYLYVPDDTDPTIRRLEPLKSLGPQEAQTLLSALESLWGHNEKYFKKACTMTNPSNHGTYVAQKKCLAHHIVWNNSEKKGDASRWAIPFACSSCTNSPCRPCVKLEWRPEDPSGTQNAILVFYPRPESSRPSDATWRDAGFYLPT